MAHILVVDDEQGFRQILNIILQRAGHTVTLASNAEQATVELRANRPDLVILDDDMPGQSGSDYCRQLKADPFTAKIPVVMYSANPALENRGFMRRIGAQAAVRKPSLPAEITNAVNACLGQIGAGV